LVNISTVFWVTVRKIWTVVVFFDSHCNFFVFLNIHMLHFNTLSLGNGSTYHGIYHFVQNYRLSLSSCKVVLFLLIINNLILLFVFILLATLSWTHFQQMLKWHHSQYPVDQWADIFVPVELFPKVTYVTCMCAWVDCS